MLPNKALVSTNYFFPGQKKFYRGKVRDVYHISDKYLVVVACDRISAFDHVLPKPIPYKGQILNQIAAYFLDATNHICPNWKITTPDPNVTIGHQCKPFKIEMVIRGYLAGHAWREYNNGKRLICGSTMPDGMKENDKFPTPIVTPTIKADRGHDSDISPAEIVSQGMISAEHWEKLEKYTRELYDFGNMMAQKNGLILVDTKYEFGLKGDEIMLIDEVHTPDSSRYFYLNEYEDLQKKGLEQKQLSKEFVRQWLIENNFQGLEGQAIPEMTEDFINSVTDRYIELFEKVTALKFEKTDYTDIDHRIENIVLMNLKQFNIQ